MRRFQNHWPMVGCFLACLCLVPMQLASGMQQQIQEDPFGLPRVNLDGARLVPNAARVNLGLVQEDEAQGDQPAKSEQEADDGPIVSTRRAAEPVDEQLVQLELWDGSRISGKLQVSTVGVQTEFGPLQVPIGRIRTISPGLDSYPELRQQLQKLVADLDDKDFEVRETAQRELIDRGVMLRQWLQSVDDQGSAERKKRLGEIMREIESLVEDLDDGLEGDLEPAMINGDTVATESFSIVGRVEQKQFVVTTPFGDLNVDLKDIKRIDRTIFGTAPEVRKVVSVNATAFFQRQPVSTRIRVERGDQIVIRGSGVVHWTNWNTTSTPSGLPNQGQYQGINAGTLVARVGSSGKLIAIGEKKEFRAANSGVLFLGIAVQDNHANNNGYQWTGSYKARVLVVPGG